MSSEYEQQLEKRNEELQSKLTVLETTHRETEMLRADLTNAMVRFVKMIRVKPTEGHPYDDGSKKLGADMTYKYLVNEVPSDRGEALLKRLLDERYELHLEWEKSRDMVQRCDKMVSIKRTKGSNEPFYVTKIVRHEKD